MSDRQNSGHGPSRLSRPPSRRGLPRPFGFRGPGRRNRHPRSCRSFDRRSGHGLTGPARRARHSSRARGVREQGPSGIVDRARDRPSNSRASVSDSWRARRSRQPAHVAPVPGTARHRRRAGSWPAACGKHSASSTVQGPAGRGPIPAKSGIENHCHSCYPTRDGTGSTNLAAMTFASRADVRTLCTAVRSAAMMA